MSNYIMMKIMENVNRTARKIRRTAGEHIGMAKLLCGREKGSAVIGEVLVMIVVVAMAAIFKSGGLEFIRSIWTTMTQTAATMFS